MNKNINFSFIAEEIVSPGTNLEIRTSRPVDAKAARAAVVLQKDGRTLATPIAVDKKGVIITVSTRDIGTGNFLLHVHQLLDIEGRELVNHTVLPVGIVALTGSVPSDLRVEHATRLTLGDTTLGRLDVADQAPINTSYVEFVKAVPRGGSKPVELAFNEKGEQVDGRKALAELRRRRYNKLGKLNEPLFNHLSGANDDDQVDVAVWPQLKVDLTGYEKPSEGEIKEPPPEARKLLEEALRSRAAVVDLLEKLGGTVKTTPAETPVVYASLTTSQARKLGQAESVGNVFLHDETGVPDLADSEAIARATQAQALGYTGTGVNAAVWEAGPDQERNLLVFAGKFSATPSVTDHARLTSAIIKNVELGKPHGYAPDCNLYSANDYSTAALRWAVQSPQNCTVISQSFHRLPEEGQDEQGSPNLSSDDILKDQLATTYPFPIIVHAAGNIDLPIEYVNHKGYNTISVGSHDDMATAMASDSVFKNPASPHGDRELPEMAANGVGVTAVGLSMSGTSFAAPAVAGTAALIQSADGTLKSWPEGCRAILLASADRNITGGTWTNDIGTIIDQSDGAGALNAQLAVLIAQQRKQRNNAVSPRGWDVGSLSDGDFGTDKLSTFRYFIKVPDSLIIGTPVSHTVKVALAWDSKLVTDAQGVLSSTLTVDHDLIVNQQDSSGTRTQVAVSASWDNSYEIVEFFGTKGATYEIVIRRFSGTDSVWFGLAWNVTSRFFFIPPIVPGLE